MTFCGCPGQLGGVGADPLGAEGCLLWRTDAQLLGSARSACPSLLYLACEVAEFYHRKCALRLTELPGAWVVIWLEMAADGSLLVFLNPHRAQPLSDTSLSRALGVFSGHMV